MDRTPYAAVVLASAVAAIAVLQRPVWAGETGPHAPPGTTPHEEPPPAPPQAEKPWGVSLDLTRHSKYVWRGITVTDEPVLQPAITFGCGNLSASVWANIDTTDSSGDRWQANEVDYTLDYAFGWKAFKFSVGAVFYQFPSAHCADTVEVYGAVGLDVPLAPTVTLYQDVDEHDGQYVVLSVGHTFEDVWKPCQGVALSVDLGASAAWGSRKHNRFYYGAGSGWADATASLGLPIKIGDHLTVTPAAHYSYILDPDVAEALGDRDVFWGGLALSVSF